MLTVEAIAAYLEEFAPLRLAAAWDNVGLLVGDPRRPVSRIMTCLTVTPDSVGEATAEKVDLIVTHHPFPFDPLRQVTTETTSGGILLALAAAGIAVYSPHTAFDSARSGINQRLAEGLGLRDVRPLMPDAIDATVGTGRIGALPASASLTDIAARVKTFLKLPTVQVVGDPQTPARTIAVACGSAGDLLEPAVSAGCDMFLTGEARFHTSLAAEAVGVGIILTGHYASERFAVDQLAELLAAQFPNATIWASRRERDPLHSL